MITIIVQSVIVLLIIRGVRSMLDADSRASEARLIAEMRRIQHASPEYQKMCAETAQYWVQRAQEDKERQKAEQEYDDRQRAISQEIWCREDDELMADSDAP